MLRKRNEKEVTTKKVLGTKIATVTLKGATIKILAEEIRINNVNENKFDTIYQSIAGRVELPTIQVNSVDLRKRDTRMRQLSQNELVVQPNIARLPLEVEERKVKV